MPLKVSDVDDVRINLSSLRQALDEQMLGLEALRQKFTKCTKEMEVLNEYCDTLVNSIEEIEGELEELKKVKPLLENVERLMSVVKDYFGDRFTSINSEQDFHKQIAIKEIFSHIDHIQGELDNG